MTHLIVTSGVRGIAISVISDATKTIFAHIKNHMRKFREIVCIRSSEPVCLALSLR